MTYRNVLLFGTALSALSPLLPAPAYAQASPSAFTAGMRYDAARRVTGTISPDPDGAGPLPFRAVRNTYDAGGRLTRVERGTLSAWQSEAVAPASWSGFTVLETVQSSYDNGDRKIRDIVSGGGTVYSVTQYSYDTLGRPRCTAVRMNPAIFPSAAGAGGSLPADACIAGTASTTYGSDRITRATRNWRGDVTRQETGVGTSERRDVATYNYTLDGQVQTITDANGNMSAFNYDGHDRMNYMFFPSATLPGEANGSDYEQYTLDANGNRTSVRRRDGQVINQSYDALNRMTLKDLPGSEPDVTYAYDNLGRMTQAARPSQPVDNINFTYDALGRRRTESSWVGTATSLYDAAGRRSRLTWPGSGLYVDYDYLDTGEMTRIRENGATSGVGVLATLGYDGLGRRTSLARGNGLVTSYGYDAVSRLASLAHDFVNPGGDVSTTFTRNPAGQLVTRTVSNTAYSFPASAVSVTDAHNGLNQITTTGGTNVTHDARGNVSVIGTAGYQYTSENQLRIGAGGAALAYDPLGRLYFAGISPPSRYLGYEGDRQIAEYDGYAGVLRRYVHGPGTDEPLVWYEGAGTSDRRWFHADERGSIVAVSAGSGGSEAIIRYDEYGRPHGPDGAGTMPTRFGYTGQAWVSEIGMWYYKARMFNSALGRFMQTDPSGYEAGTNIYAYVRGDPINLNDPDGRHESHWLLRLLVPGQIAWDDAVTAAEDGRWGAAAGSLTRMAGEIALTVVPAGRIAAAAENAAARMSTSATRSAGDLTRSEARQIQRVVNRAERPLDVVGSAARGERRGVGTDLPIGKGPGTRSDIDYTTAGANRGHFDGLEGQLPSANPETPILRGTPNPHEGPSIRFEPRGTSWDRIRNWWNNRE